MNIVRPVVFTSILVLMQLGAGCVSAESYGIAVVVNGKPITTSEVREAVQAQEQLIRMTVKDEKSAQAKLAELRASALFALIERQLVLSEFEKLGGSIKPQYVEDDINNIIRESFEGDRNKFLYELQKTG